jgi:hypothetical protein
MIIGLFYFTDEVEIHNNPNLHSSEEQDELEIPDGKEFFQNNIYNILKLLITNLLFI